MEILLLFGFLFVFLPKIVCGGVIAALWVLEKLIVMVFAALMAVLECFAWAIAPQSHDVDHQDNQSPIERK